MLQIILAVRISYIPNFVRPLPKSLIEIESDSCRISETTLIIRPSGMRSAMGYAVKLFMGDLLPVRAGKFGTPGNRLEKGDAIIVH
jgi:hypothetical protein